MNSDETFVDPICGMEVDPESAAARVEREGGKFYFCSIHCRDEFVRQGSNDHAHEAAPANKPASEYFCPMCEGVESDKPGACPKCGMALERNPTFHAPAVY